MQHSASDRTLYLIDGTAQLFRAYFAIRGLTNTEGLPTSAVYGFTTMLRKLIQDEHPPYVAAAFDAGGDVFRHAAYADYKANRPPVPEDLDVQVPWTKHVCEALGVPVVELAGYEADDLIATFARRAREEGFEVVVVAADKDLLQLVGPGVTVLNPSKNIRLDEAGVRQSFGVSPQLVRDVLGLMGDSVDNIPGVPGVGEKTAIAVVTTYGGLEAVLDRAARFAAAFAGRDRLLEAIERRLAGEADEAALSDAATSFASQLDRLLEVEGDAELRVREAALRQALDAAIADARSGGAQASKGLKALKQELKSLERGSAKRVWLAIHENEERARLSRDLATLNEEVPFGGTLEGMRYRGANRERTLELFGTLGFRSLVREVEQGTGGWEEPGSATSSVSESRARHETVVDEDGLALLAESLRGTGRFAIETETDHPDPLRSRLVGIALSWEEGSGVFVPVGPDSGAGRMSLERAGEHLRALLCDPGTSKIGHDLIRDAHVLRRHGLPVEGWGLDTMVAAFLLDSGRSDYSLGALAGAYLGRPTTRDKEGGGAGARQATLGQVDFERLTERATEDAEATLRLANLLEPRLAAQGLRELYDRIDGPLLPVLVKMEAHGIRVDTAVLQEMSGEMQIAIERSRAEIHRLAGFEFNIDSPKQLREVLFERLGLAPGRKTAKARVASTDAQTLEDLSESHPIARAILDYRELTKLKSTYVDALPRLVHPETGRVHTSFNPAGAATGRLSSADPNLQNIPARTEVGRRIRSAFVPAEGYRFLASDYSQVELRILAHLAQDEELIAAFRAGEDIHRYTAARIFGVAGELVTDTMRQRAKAVNFGILYGMSEVRLAREQGIPRADARRFIQAYFERFSGVRAYIDRVREQVQQDGAVRTLFGRLRSFPQLRQRIDRAAREQALRAAVNTTIQGTAADLMKLAMLRVDRLITDRVPRARLLLQVHDELLLEAPPEEVPRLRELVREAMEQSHELTVPLVVDQKDGESWFDVT